MPGSSKYRPVNPTEAGGGVSTASATEHHVRHSQIPPRHRSLFLLRGCRRRNQRERKKKKKFAARPSECRRRCALPSLRPVHLVRCLACGHVVPCPAMPCAPLPLWHLPRARPQQREAYLSGPPSPPGRPSQAEARVAVPSFFLWFLFFCLLVPLRPPPPPPTGRHDGGGTTLMSPPPSGPRPRDPSPALHPSASLPKKPKPKPSLPRRATPPRPVGRPAPHRTPAPRFTSAVQSSPELLCTH